MVTNEELLTKIVEELTKKQDLVFTHKDHLGILTQNSLPKDKNGVLKEGLLAHLINKSFTIPREEVEAYQERHHDTDPTKT